MSKSGARVLIVDADEIVRAGLSTVLSGFSLVRVVGSLAPPEAVSACQSLEPDIALLDVSVRDLAGAALVADVRRVSPRTAIVVFTHRDDPQLVLETIGAGARAYVLKGSPAGLLATAIDSVLGGEAFVDPVLAGRVIASLAAPSGRQGSAPRPDPLTDRERDVLRQVAKGRSNKEIAGTLDLAAGTVKIHIEHILQKLVASNRAEATTRAFELGILELDDDPAPSPMPAARVQP
jgi:DNA-binding NarL/FixJ family response regulator